MTVENLFEELLEQTNVRTNLSELRQMLKESGQRKRIMSQMKGKEESFLAFLKDEDPKVRKNAALLFGDLKLQQAADAIYETYLNEETLFVKASYLTALSHLNMVEKLPELRDILDDLLESRPQEEIRKHIEEEIREIRAILVSYEGITEHTFCYPQEPVEVLLLTNREHRGFIRKQITACEAKIHPMGVSFITNDFSEAEQLRTYKQLVFPVHADGFIETEPRTAAEQIWNSDFYKLLCSMHKEAGPFYYRLDCTGTMSLEERSEFSKNFGAELEWLSEGELINCPDHYEFELRLVANKEGKFFPYFRAMTYKDKRFQYRRGSISASIHPATAALMMELAVDYLKEDAQIIDPFCGVGTMLIERDILREAREIYAIDTFGDAIRKGRMNSKYAGTQINFIQRDFFDFKHDYKFDEIVTNMPIQGKMSKEQMDELYRKFFSKAEEILADEAVVMMYTNEEGLVKKHLRLNTRFKMEKEIVMNAKKGFYLYVIKFKAEN